MWGINRFLHTKSGFSVKHSNPSPDPLKTKTKMWMPPTPKHHYPCYRVISFIPPTPSPSQTLISLIPLLNSLHPIISTRISGPTPPPWMDSATAKALLSLSDTDLQHLESNPCSIPSFFHSNYSLFSNLHVLSHSFLSASFPPFISSDDETKLTDIGRSKRRSKSRPRASKRTQIKQLTSLLSETLQKAKHPVHRIVDVGAGHGHLSAHFSREMDINIPIVALERDPMLVSTASSLHFSRSHSNSRTLPKSFSIIQTDACNNDESTSTYKQNDAIIGLHACGSLGDSLLTNSVTNNASAIILVSCCLQKISSLNNTRIPLSKIACTNESLSKHLTLSRSQLGATNTTRGYKNPMDLTARETRHAIRTLLSDAGKPIAHIGDEVVGISRHALRHGLSAVILDVLSVHGLDFDVNCEEVEQRMHNAKIEYRDMRALALPRAFATAVVEMAIVLDRAAYIEEAGYHVSTCRIWNDNISPRNLTLVGWQ